MPQLAYCDPNTGDTKVTWNRNNRDEVENAKHTFDSLKGKGFKAFAMTGPGEKGSLITTFDPNIESILMVPPLAGG